MKILRTSFLILTIGLVGLALASCGKHSAGNGHDHGKEKTESEGGHNHEDEAATGASFRAGKGVILTDETRKSLGVETAEVNERKLNPEIRFTVQVFGENHKATAAETYHAECTAKAAGLLSQEKATQVRAGAPTELATKSGTSLCGVVLGITKALAIGDVEVIIGVTNSETSLKPGDFLSANISIARDTLVMVVPKSAVLASAEGNFVYVVNGEAYLRTAVKTGVEAEGLVEVTDGLLAGDGVVTRPVEKLWIIELRATKGGGHSH